VPLVRKTISRHTDIRSFHRLGLHRCESTLRSFSDARYRLAYTQRSIRV